MLNRKSVLTSQEKIPCFHLLKQPAWESPLIEMFNTQAGKNGSHPARNTSYNRVVVFIQTEKS